MVSFFEEFEVKENLNSPGILQSKSCRNYEIVFILHLSELIQLLKLIFTITLFLNNHA